MAALMEPPVKFIWTHDAFRVGEDGPTHEPVEQEAQIRLMENVILVASGSEVATLVAGTELLRKDGVKVRIVSAPSEGLFRNQPKRISGSCSPGRCKDFRYDCRSAC